MAKLKARDLKKMNRTERERKLEELRFELIKSRAGEAKTGSSKIREIRRLIARILTLNSNK
jgi:ribosomal protein L29